MFYRGGRRQGETKDTSPILAEGWKDAPADYSSLQRFQVGNKNIDSYYLH